MAFKSILNTLDGYVYGSPRYHSIITYPSKYAPDDYLYQDSINGTYDKHFPLYTLNSNSIPILNLIDSNGVKSEVKGDLAVKLRQKSDKVRKVGRQEEFNTVPLNSNLTAKEVITDSYSTMNINPGWCVIQTKSYIEDNTVKYQPYILTRILGNTLLSSELYAIELDEDKVVSTEDFIPGTIVKYKENIWKCLSPTKIYPPSSFNQQSDSWFSIEARNNIFYVDIFLLSEEGSAYFIELEESDRHFNPVLEGDITEDTNTLVSWNLAYYYN